MDRGDCSCAAARLHDHKVVASYLKLFFSSSNCGENKGSVLCHTENWRSVGAKNTWLCRCCTCEQSHHHWQHEVLLLHGWGPAWLVPAVDNKGKDTQLLCLCSLPQIGHQEPLFPSRNLLYTWLLPQSSSLRHLRATPVPATDLNDERVISAHIETSRRVAEQRDTPHR